MKIFTILYSFLFIGNSIGISTRGKFTLIDFIGDQCLYKCNKVLMIQIPKFWATNSVKKLIFELSRHKIATMIRFFLQLLVPDLVSFMRNHGDQDLTLRNKQFSVEEFNRIVALLKNTDDLDCELVNNNMTSREILILVSSLRHTSVTTLAIAQNNMENISREFGELLSHTNITELVLRDNSIGDEEVRSICYNMHRTKINSLDLSSNKITEQGAKYFPLCLNSTSLKKLFVQGNEKIGMEGAVSIVNASRNSELRELNLSTVNLTNEGAIQMAGVMKYTPITSFHLNGNGIEDSGMIALVNAVSNRSSINFFLVDNRIGNDGARAIIKGIELRAIEHFAVYGNRIDGVTQNNLYETSRRIRYSLYDIREMFCQFVTYSNSSVEFKIQNPFTKESQYRNFTAEILINKPFYLEKFTFISHYCVFCPRTALEEFIWNIEQRLETALNKAQSLNNGTVGNIAVNHSPPNEESTIEP